MKFICDRIEFTEAINISQKAVASKSTNPILEGLLIKTNSDSIIITGNNTDIGIETSINATVDEEGIIVLNAKLFGEIVRKLTGDLITIEVTNDVTTIKCGNSKFKISGINADEYPEIPLFDFDFELSLTKKQFRDLIKYTIFAVGSTEIKPIFSGCLLEVENNIARMVAIDGIRMALKIVENEKPFIDDEIKSIVIPSKTLNEVVKLTEDSEDLVKLSWNTKNIKIKFDNVIITSRLLEGEFIDYKKMIPAEFKTSINIKTREIVGAVDRCSLVIVNDIIKSPVVFNIVDKEIKINCESSTGKAEEFIPVDVIGNDIIIGFNDKYILEALRTVTTEEIKLNFNESTSPCLITPIKGDDFKFIVLPVRLS